MKILLIEDEKHWQETLVQMLNELNYNDIVVCSTHKQAFDILNKETFNVLISDIILGDHSIFDIEPILLQKKIPCIFISAYPSIGNFEKSMHIENVQFLVKPFHQLTLKSIMQNLMHDQQDDEKGIFISGKYGQKTLIKFNSIQWLKGEGNYTYIHTSNQKKFTIKKSLLKVSADLDKKFIQVQRALYVNASCISKTVLSKDELYIDDNSFKIGRPYRSLLIDYLNNLD